MDKEVLIALRNWYKSFLEELDRDDNRIVPDGTLLIAISKVLGYDTDVYYHNLPRNENCEESAFQIPLVKDIYKFAKSTAAPLTVHATTYIALFCESAEDIIQQVAFLQLCNAFSNKPAELITALHVQNVFSLQPLNTETKERLWKMTKIKDPEGDERNCIFYMTEILEIIKEAKEQTNIFTQFTPSGFNKIH